MLGTLLAKNLQKLFVALFTKGFIKHNLNAEAVRSLKTTVLKMDVEVTKLVADIEASTKEADAFLATLPTN